jgi:hypothetical protein
MEPDRRKQARAEGRAETEGTIETRKDAEPRDQKTGQLRVSGL